MLKILEPDWKGASLGCCAAPLKNMAQGFMRSQRMASIALTIIGLIG